MLSRSGLGLEALQPPPTGVANHGSLCGTATRGSARALACGWAGTPGSRNCFAKEVPLHASRYCSRRDACLIE
eukprot:5207352-Alexandrium_andersonii.AAC.1